MLGAVIRAEESLRNKTFCNAGSPLRRRMSAESSWIHREQWVAENDFFFGIGHRLEDHCDVLVTEHASSKKWTLNCSEPGGALPGGVCVNMTPGDLRDPRN